PAIRLVTAKDARVALQRLAQAAGLGLRVGRSLAGTDVPRVLAQVRRGPPGQRRVMAGTVDVHDAVVGDAVPRQPAHGPCDRADVVAEAVERRLGREDAMAAVLSEGLFLAAQDDR